MFKGIYTSMVTPYKNGKVVSSMLIRLIERQLRSGIHGVVLFANAGEGFLLLPKEKRLIVDTAVKKVSSMAQVIVDCTAIATEDVLNNVKMAEDGGADGIIVSASPYVLPSQDGLLTHYLKIADESNLPVVVNNAPKQTGVEIEFATLVRLAEHENIHSIAETHTESHKIQKLKSHMDNKIDLIGGNDFAAVPMLISGANAIISKSANIIPKEWIELWESRLNGDMLNAQRLHSSMVGLHEALELEPGSGAIKAALNLLGLCSSEIRLPMMWPLRPTVYRIAAEIEGLGLRIQTGELA